MALHLDPGKKQPVWLVCSSCLIILKPYLRRLKIGVVQVQAEPPGVLASHAAGAIKPNTTKPSKAL